MIANISRIDKFAKMIVSKWFYPPQAKINRSISTCRIPYIHSLAQKTFSFVNTSDPGMFRNRIIGLLVIQELGRSFISGA